jgi:signal transduction histidine kinase
MRSSIQARPTVLAPALATLCGAAILLAGIEAALFVDGPFEPLWVLLLFPFGGLVYVGAGTLAWSRRPSNRMGALIVCGGFVWLATGLANSTVPALIAVGLIVQTVPLAIAVHLLHAFPSGRLRGRASRITVAVGYFVTLVLQAPSYLFDQGPEGPQTVLQIVDSPELGLIGYWIRISVGAAVMVSTAVILSRRLSRAAPRQRRTWAPLSVFGILAVLFVPISGAIVQTWLPGAAVDVAVAQLLVMTGLPVAFVAAVLLGGFARTGEIQELGAWLAVEEGRPALETALRGALGDPSLTVHYWVPEPRGYVDRAGLPMRPQPSDTRALTEVTLAERRIGAIVYDATLIGEGRAVAEAAQVVAIALDRERLAAELLASSEGLRESRARLLEATDAERRRIARDLHDGLQTRLVLLAMQAGRTDGDPGELSSGLQEAIAELRGLVQGVVPAALTERGLYAAAEELTDQMPIPVALDLAQPAPILPSTVETAGYFIVSEALSNAVKHAGADELRLAIDRRNGHLRIEVADDGIGGAQPAGGLSGLADRIAALGGRLVIESPPGGGTKIVAEMPCGS